jgi:predicted DsbA family dithiol-disulfide isomerase
VRVERLQQEYAVEVVWEPFELHPEIPPAGIPMTDRMRLSRARTTERLRALAEEAGIAIRPISVIPNSRLALEAAEFARDAGRFDDFHRAVFAALFGDDQNIGDVRVLVRLAEESGIDAATLEQALHDRRYRQQVDERIVRLQEQGISGTPTFVFDDRFEVVGAQEYAVFESVAQRMGAEKRSPQ